MPNPPGAGLPNPALYDLDDPEIVLDRRTGLRFQRRMPAESVAWQRARDYCADLDLAGFDDWRVPSAIELVSIVDFGVTDPAIDRAAFPGTPGDSVWTATLVAGSETDAWYVGFSHGYTYRGDRELLAIRVRCVRSSAARAGTPPARYQPSAGLVLDTRTGLTWQAKAGAEPSDFAGAAARCAGLAIDGGGFRAPSMKELATLLDAARAYPAIDGGAFPDTPSAAFWTSSPFAGSATEAWAVDFGSGVINTQDRTAQGLVRCVR